jgi:DNA-binding NarL/FixJ family response regulator
MGSELIQNALDHSSDFRVLACVTTSVELEHKLRTSRPDVVLTAFRLADDAAHPTIAVIQKISSITRVVALTLSTEDEVVLQVFRAGAKGLLLRSRTGLESLRKCLRAVHAGQIWADSRQLNLILDAFARPAPFRVVNMMGKPLLSRREEELVQLLGEGLSNREIAQHMKISEHTVKNYLCRVFDKLGVSSRMEVLLYAMGASVRQPLMVPDLQQQQAS